MLIYPEGQTSALRGDLVVKSILRSDLVPIPQNVELELRDAPETQAIQKGSLIKVGRQEAEFLVVKSSPGGDSGLTAGERPVRIRKLVGLLASCAPIAQRTHRAIIRRNATLGEIYRGCGAQVRIDSDFTVGTFVCLKGMTPSFEIAKALQEEAGALVMVNGRIAFRRLTELLKSDPVVTLRESSMQAVESDFLEQHLVPFAFSTAVGGGFVTGRAEGGHGVMYRPRADERILNNLGTVLVQRGRINSDFAPHMMAGMRLDVGGRPMVVITAMHYEDGGADGDGGSQYTRLWVGEITK